MTFEEHLKKYLDDNEIKDLIDSFNKEDKHAVLLNLRKMSDEMFLSIYPNVIKHPIVEHAYIYDKNEYELGKSIYYKLGCFYLQEPSAMIASWLLHPQKDSFVLDMCAAPGGKTIGASFLMDNTGLIVSNDISKDRCLSELENIENLGIGNVVITNNDLSLIAHKIKEKYHYVILDAPCSGSGMFRKDQKMRDDWSYNKVLKFAELQKELILIGYESLKPGGTMIYSTCSYSYEEDEEVINYLLDKTNAIIKEIPQNDLFYSSKHNLGIHLFSSRFSGEGHYICLIQKPGELVLQGNKKVKNNASKKYKCDESLLCKEFGNYLFGVTQEFDVSPFSIIRYGVKIGELFKDQLRFDNHYSRYIKSFDRVYELNDSELEKYMMGDYLESTLEKGWVLLKYHSISFSLAKADGRIIKNNYPKYLRHR